MNDNELDELEALARAATGTTWSVEKHGDGHIILADSGPVPGTEDEKFGPQYRHGLNLLYIKEPDWNWENNRAYLNKVGPGTILKLVGMIRAYQQTNEDRNDAYDRIRKACSANGSEMDRET
jgi:hypothetical protein